MESSGFVGGTSRLILRLEGAAVFAFSLFAYHLDGASWWLFLILILAPDLSAVGYLAGQRAGNACYNAAHNYLPPIALAACALAGGPAILLSLGLVWAAHIGADRMLGYGLKLDGFSLTHLGPIGKARAGRVADAHISPQAPERAPR